MKLHRTTAIAFVAVLAISLSSEARDEKQESEKSPCSAPMCTAIHCPQARLRRMGSVRYSPGTHGRLLWCPNGNQLVADAATGIGVFDRDGKLVRVLAGRSISVGPSLFTPDGKTLLIAAGNEITLLDFATGQERKKLAGHERGVTARRLRATASDLPLETKRAWFASGMSRPASSSIV